MSEREKIIDTLIGSVRFSPGPRSHIELSPERCRRCVERVCLSICPAGVYVEGDGEIVVRWERCLECGSCTYACSYIKWNYPQGGKGVIYFFG